MLPKVYWMDDPSGNLQYSIKTYEMVSAGKAWSVDFQVNPKNGLPNLFDRSYNRMGVGIYWEADPGGSVDINAKGYPTSVVRDPAGTILLCEDSSTQGTMGNQWPSCCQGPWISDGGANGNLYQIDAAAPTDVAKLKTDHFSTGSLLYKAQNNRFNYAFHDGHVEPLKYEDTLGSASGPLQVRVQNPKGMWTIAAGD